MPDIVMDLVYGSYLRAAPSLHGPDSVTRNIDWTRQLLTTLQVDLHRWPSITVTGSKGKGSTAVLLASMLHASGERVGLISSPEMRYFNERIRLNGRCVSDEVLLAAAQKIAPSVQDLVARIEPPDYLGPGGVILALAATIFAEASITVLIAEAGRGGEYDETRLLEADVSVLTPIMLEHPDKLGATVEAIARTKALITAPGSPLVMAPQTGKAAAIIEQVAVELSSPLRSVSAEMQFACLKDEPAGVDCTIQFGADQYSNLHLSLAGQHQIENAATAILALHMLKDYGVNGDEKAIFEGLGRVHWPGRAQMLQQRPWVLLDGAINGESARHIRQIVQNYPARRVTAIVCVPSPKDLDGLCAQIAPIADRLILTEIPLPTLTWYDDAVSIASRYSANVQMLTPVEKAFAAAMEQAESDEGILLLGTQSFLSSALSFWDSETCSLW